RGLEVSPGGLLQNELVQRQIRDCLAQPAVLELKVLQALHLLGLEPAELLAPPIIRHLAHPDLADCVHHVLALRDQNIDLPQLRNHLFRLVSLPCHCSPPGCQRHTSSRTTSMGVDHSIASAETGTLIPAETIGAVHSQCLRWVSIATKEVEPDD